MDETPKKTSKLVSALLNRQAGGTKASPSAHREPDLPEGWPENLPFRKRPKPYSRAIAWTPKAEPGQGFQSDKIDRSRDYELFVSQRVFGEMRHHLITASTAEPFGFLLGKVIYCPWTEAPYIVVDALRRETQNLPSSSEVDRFRHAWIGATRDARHRRSQVIGWYHKHGVLGLRLSEWDLKLQEEFFPEPWQCALIITSSGGPAGGFIQRSHRARLFRKGLAPFYELVDLDARLVEHLRPTLVDWRNYQADQKVHVIEAPWSEPERVAGSIGSDVPETVGTLRLRGRKWARSQPHEPSDQPKIRLADVGRPEPAPPADEFDEDEFREALPKRIEPSETTEAPAASSAPARERLEVDTPVRGATETPSAPADGSTTEAERPSEADGAAAPAARDDAPASAPTGPLPIEGKPHEPEPPEVDEVRSEEWLVSLVSEVLAIREDLETKADTAEAAQAPEEAAEAPTDAAEAPAEAAQAPEEAAEAPTEESVEVEEAAVPAAEEEDAVEASTEETGTQPEVEPAPAAAETPAAPAAAEAPAPAAAETPAAPAAPHPEREVAAATASTPPIKRMGPIPVVLVEDLPWRPSRKLIRGTIAGIVILGATIAGFMLVDRPEPIVPGSFAQVAPPAPQSAEFSRLVTAFRSQLQSYRVHLLDYQEGEIGCEPLAASFGLLREGHGQILLYGETAPDLAGRIETIDIDYRGALGRYEATGCVLPPEPPPAEGAGSRIVGADGTATSLVPSEVPSTG